MFYIDDAEDIMSLCDFIIDIFPYSEYCDNKNLKSCLLSALVMYLKMYRPKHQQNFTSVMKLLRAMKTDKYGPEKTTPLDKMFADVFTKDPGSIMLKQYMDIKIGNA